MTFDILPQIAFVFMLIFARVGTMLMLMPAIGEGMIPARLKLVFALAFAFVLYPLVADAYPPLPPTVPAILELLGQELLVGFFVGLVARLVMACLQVAGSTIAFQTGLGFAQNVDPTQGMQGAIFSSFLSMLGLTLIFATDLHHLLLAAIHDSYVLFRPGAALPIGDGAMIATRTVAATFSVGLQIAAPFVAFGLIFYLGLGVLARLMPQIQVFFLAMPANILLGFLMLLVLLGGMMAWFLEHVERSVMPFVAQ